MKKDVETLTLQCSCLGHFIYLYQVRLGFCEYLSFEIIGKDFFFLTEYARSKDHTACH